MIGIHSMSLGDRIKAKVRVDDNECWLWQESLLRSGYALIRYKGKKVTVHRAAYTAFVGPIPQGLYVLHKCDVRHCCNPSHLFLGTQSDNMKDCEDKGRNAGKFKSGKDHPLHQGKFKPTRLKLTPEDVAMIRSHPYGPGARDQLAKMFGVATKTISDVRNHHRL